jgi:RecA-family ATPase
MNTHTFDEYLALGDSSVWLVQDLLPVGGKINIMGEPKVGKSFFALQLAEALSRARTTRWLEHFPVLSKGPVFFLQLDTSRAVWQDRLRKVRHLLDLTHVIWSDKLDLPKNFDIRIPAHTRTLNEALGELPEWPKAVIVDVIRSVHKGSEDESSNMQDVIDSLQEATGNALLAVLSHTRKPSADKKQRADNVESMNENRGSNALNGSVDTLIKLTQQGLYVEPRSAERFHLPMTQSRGGLWTVTPECEPVTAASLVGIVAKVIADHSLRTKREKRQALIQQGLTPTAAMEAVP